MSEIKDIVSLSSRMAAAVRAIETQRADGLFQDPLAAKLAGDELIAEVAPTTQQYEDNGTPVIIVRTRFFDDFLKQEAAGIRQVVLLGAGMDTRAFRLSWPADTHLFELDRSEVLEYKNSILGDALSQCYRSSLGVDIRSSWEEQLIAQGYRIDMPTVWIMEGLLYYLNEVDVQALLTTVTQLSVSGSWIGADLLNSYFVANNTGELSQHWKYGCDEPEKLFATYHWQASVLQAGDEGAHFGRFTRPMQPREIKDVPHYFFVKAHLEKP